MKLPAISAWCGACAHIPERGHAKLAIVRQDFGIPRRKSREDAFSTMPVALS
jgi:hypothetical protein